MRYFRYFPLGLQTIMFSILVLTMWLFVPWCIDTFLQKFTGLKIDFLDTLDQHSPYQLIKTAIILQGASSAFFFIVPAFLFAYLTHPHPLQYLGLVAPGNNNPKLIFTQIIIVIFTMLGAIPFLDKLDSMMSLLPISKAMQDAQKANDKITGAFLTMPDFNALLRTLLALAIIPALGEELFFRGIGMKLVRKVSTGMFFPILSTAVLFAASHLNIYGLPSIFIAGVLLAYIYYLTGSLWCSILAHALFNGTQILLSYGADHNSSVKRFAEITQDSWIFVLCSLALFCGSFYMLVKYKTPLPDDWTDDFKGETVTEDVTT